MFGIYSTPRSLTLSTVWVEEPSNVEYPHHLSHLSLQPGQGSWPALYAKLRPYCTQLAPLFDPAQVCRPYPRLS